MKAIARCLVIAAFALAGCGGNQDYDRTELTGIVKLQDAECTRERIVVKHGTALKVHIVSKNDGDDDMTNQVSSRNPNIVEVAPVITEHDWTFLGITPGHAEVEIKADNKTVLIIDAWVVAQ